MIIGLLFQGLCLYVLLDNTTKGAALCSMSCSQQCGATSGVNQQRLTKVVVNPKNPSQFRLHFKDGIVSPVRECVERRGPFYIFRTNGNAFRCIKEIPVNKSFKVVHVYLTPYRKFKQTPTICEACRGFMKKPEVYAAAGIPILQALAIKPDPMGCNLPKDCPVVNPYYERPCTGCEPYQDDGLCCDGCQKCTWNPANTFRNL